jgi:internalin A
MHAESDGRLKAALESGRLLGECDLANLKLTEIPPEAMRIPNLRVLSLRGNGITEVPSAIANLSCLRVLALDDNQIASLPSSIGDLAGLERLTLTGNLLTELPSEIGNLCSLESLTVSRNRLMSLPPEVGRLSNLETLAASSNQLRDLPAAISGLRNLQVLSLGNNQLTSLPSYIAAMLRAGLVLRIEANPFAGPVIELYERGPSALAAYLESLTSAVPRYEAKMLLVGAGNAGKTSLLTALRGGRFLAGRTTTHGIEVHPVALRHASTGREMTVFAWDFGGQEIYRETHQLFFTRNALYLVIWNPREGPEQAEVAGWLHRIRQRIVTEARVFIVATHCAGERHPDLDYPTLAAEFPELLAGSFETDSSTGDGIGELGHAVAAELTRGDSRFRRY